LELRRLLGPAEVVCSARWPAIRGEVGGETRLGRDAAEEVEPDAWGLARGRLKSARVGTLGGIVVGEWGVRESERRRRDQKSNRWIWMGLATTESSRKRWQKGPTGVFVSRGARGCSDRNGGMVRVGPRAARGQEAYACMHACMAVERQVERTMLLQKCPIHTLVDECKHRQNGKR
jgi:hypothetical protein